MFFHRLSPCLTRLPGLVQQSESSFHGAFASLADTRASHKLLTPHVENPRCSVQLCSSLPVHPWIRRRGRPSRRHGPLDVAPAAGDEPAMDLGGALPCRVRRTVACSPSPGPYSPSSTPSITPPSPPPP